MGSIRTAGAAAVLTAGLLLQQGCASGHKPAAKRAGGQPSMAQSQQMHETLMHHRPQRPRGHRRRGACRT